MKKYSLYALVLALLGVIIIITSFFIYLSISIQRERLIDEEIKTKTHLAETINETLYSPLWVYRIGMFPGIEKVLIEEIAKFEDVVYLRIVSVDGTIHQSTIEGEWGRRIEDIELLPLLLTEATITREEIFQEERIKSIIYPGYGERVILMGFSLKGVEQTIREMIAHNILIDFGSLGLVILVTFLVLRKSIINPLKEMVAVCQEVGKGNLDVKADIKSKTEIGELAEEFSLMIRKLKEIKEALEIERMALEIKVKSRTKELEKLTQNLDEKVKEKTRELQERVEELEKFHRLTVGRELKMIKLKEDLENLKKEFEKKNRDKN